MWSRYLSILLYRLAGRHILGGGLYLSWMAGIDLTTARILVALGFGIYCVVGGYFAVIWTDTIQAVVLFAGFILMAVLALVEVGGFSGLRRVWMQAPRAF